MTTLPKTAVQAFNSTCSSIVGIKTNSSELIAKAFVAFIVTELVGSFNVGKTMDDMQVTFAVNGIIEDYYFLKIDELKYCFSNAKKGKYGTMYDRIDAAVIFGWIEKYLEERMEIACVQNEEQNKKFKKEQIPEVIVDMLKGSIKKENQPETKLNMIQKRELTPHEIAIQDIFREFDALHKNKPYDPTESFRTIPYSNKNLSISEFLEVRLEELNKL